MRPEYSFSGMPIWNNWKNFLSDFKRSYNLDFPHLYIHEIFLENFENRKILYLKQIIVTSCNF